MQQRQLRLGDILDDYCPRERRVTNHAVVAMVGSDVKQTRCTTCDAEHEYKHAKVPATKRKKDAPPALFKQVLANAQPEALKVSEPAGEDTRANEEPAPPLATPTAVDHLSSRPAPAAAEEPAEPQEEPEAEAEPPEAGDEEGPVHRRLIRATLPRPEGQV